MVKEILTASGLTVTGILLFIVASIDWMTAKLNVSQRHCLIPLRVAQEFLLAIGAVFRGQSREPSLRACTRWNRHASGPFAR